MIHYVLILLMIMASPLTIEVMDTGDAVCTYTLQVDNAPAVVNISLVGSAYIVEAYDSYGEEASFNISNGKLELYVFENTSVTIRYLTVLAMRKDRLWIINFTADVPVKLVLPENSVIAYLDPIPENLEVSSNRTILYYSGGPIYIEYMIYTSLPPPTTETSTKTSPQTTTQQISSGGNEFLYLILLIILVGATGTILYFSRKRTANKTLPELDERDLEIIKAIKELGGSATPAEIMEKTKIPKTPLYRRLQRLVEYGVLREVPGRRKKYKITHDKLP